MKKFLSVIIFLFFASDTGFAAHKYLSEYNFFVNLKNQIPSQDVIPYGIANPLFSDYAYKLCFIHMGASSSAVYNYEEVFEFPKGTTIIKTFAYPVDERDKESGLILLETRLLVHEEDGWKPYNYIWNQQQTDAKLKVTGHTFQIEWTNVVGKKKKVRYRAPNINQCKSCHEIDNRIMPIGPKGRNMNINFGYYSGQENQIQYWSRNMILKNIPKRLKSNPAIWNNNMFPIEDRARSYLDANCAHCHRRGGSASSSGFYLDLEEKVPVTLGIKKRPVAAGRGSGNFKYIIEPGNAKESILLFRMMSTDPGIMMPELSRSLNHEEAIPLIEEWIKELR